MFGILIAVAATFFQEVSSVIGKEEISHKRENLFTAGFLILFWGTIWFAAIIIYRGVFVFSLDSLPTFSARIILEIIGIEVSLLAMAKADRTTFSFIHTGTVPFLLGVDVFLGYKIDPGQLIGMAAFCGLVLFLIMHHGIRREGVFYAILSTVLAVGTISLYKYNITHFNAPESEQFASQLILLCYLCFMGILVRKENPFRFFFHQRPFIQSFSAGIAGVGLSFAYSFAPASIILSAKRIGEIFWSTASGGLYFHEKHMLLKMGVMAGLIVSLLFLIKA